MIVHQFKVHRDSETTRSAPGRHAGGTFHPARRTLHYRPMPEIAQGIESKWTRFEVEGTESPSN